MEIRYFSYTNISLQYRYGRITMCFTDSFTWHRLRPANEHRLQPANEHRLRPANEHCLRPANEHRLRPANEHRLRTVLSFFF